jgi:membrane-associated protein
MDLLVTWVRYFNIIALLQILISNNIFHLQDIFQLLLQYKYFILFPLCVVEGPVVSIIAGFLCANGILNAWVAFPIIVVGDITGDTACYSMGRWGIPLFVKRIVLRWGLKPERIENIRKTFTKNPIRTIALSKIALGIGVAGIFLAGNAKVRYLTFISICLVTSCLQHIIYLGTGWLFGDAWIRIGHYLNFFGTVTLVTGGTVGLFLLIRSIRKKI